MRWLAACLLLAGCANCDLGSPCTWRLGITIPIPPGVWIQGPGPIFTE